MADAFFQSILSESGFHINKKTIFAQIFVQMKKVYKVAGHKFSIVMPDDYPAWNEMQNYEPFLTDDADGCIFAAELIENMPDTSSKQLVVIGNKHVDMPRSELYEWNGKWLMEVAPTLEAPIRLCMITDKSFSKVQFRVLGCIRFSVTTMLMMMFSFSTASMDTLLIHASVTMNGGKGYLFLGKSGTGKSTHSQLWIKNIEGCELLNDDNPALRVCDDGVVRVYGTPWSGKTPCYRNLDVPVGAIVDLHQAKKNVIKQQSLPEAYASIYVSFSGYRFIKNMADGYHATNAKIVSSVPCYSLDCLPNPEAAFLCYDTVTGKR